jgi:septum formation protein
MSPRRRELLAQLGVAHVVRAPHIDEAVHPGEAAADYVVRMARTKALTVARDSGGVPVLAADTIVVIDELILGKPADMDAGLAMLERLSGRAHEVLTAVALAAAENSRFHLSASAVRFRALSREECRAYWRSAKAARQGGRLRGAGVRRGLHRASQRGSYLAVGAAPV